MIDAERRRSAYNRPDLDARRDDGIEALVDRQCRKAAYRQSAEVNATGIDHNIEIAVGEGLGHDRAGNDESEGMLAVPPRLHVLAALCSTDTSCPPCR